jgi:hypothetical protein
VQRENRFIKPMVVSIATFDGRYAYLLGARRGYIGRIPIILDLKIRRTRRRSCWWTLGQWLAGGEAQLGRHLAHQCHHPIRYGDRLCQLPARRFVILDTRT